MADRGPAPPRGHRLGGSYALQRAPAAEQTLEDDTGDKEEVETPEGSYWQRLALWAFTKGLSALGIDPEPVLAFIKRAGSFFFSIIKNIGGFVANVMTAIQAGFQKFWDNIRQHLMAGLVGFLAGSLVKEGITPPQDTSARSILGCVLEAIGLTPDGFREKLDARLRKKGIDLAPLERAWSFLSELLGGGVQGFITGLLAYAGNLKAMLIDSLVTWLSTAVLQKGLEFIAALAIPGAAAVRTLINVVKFLRERAGQIAALFRAVLGTVSALAKGEVEPTANKIEQTLARVLPVAIGFLAGLLGVGDLVAKGVKKILGTLGKVVDKVFDTVVGLAEKTWAKLFGGRKKGRKEAADGEAAPDEQGAVDWAGLGSRFTDDDGDPHRLFIDGSGEARDVAVASNTQRIPAFLARARGRLAKSTDGGDAHKRQALDNADGQYKKALGSVTRLTGLRKKSGVRELVRKEEGLLRAQLRSLGESIAILGVDDASKRKPLKTKLQPSSGTGRTRHIVADPLTPLHGNTIGSKPPGGDKKVPPGWAHLTTVALARPKLRVTDYWVRMHLIHEEMHGPGQAFNLVPATSAVNSRAYSRVERPALAALSDPDAVLSYDVNVEYHKATKARPELADFPRRLTFQWSRYQDAEGSKKGKLQGPKSFDIGEEEVPDLAGAVVPTTLELSKLTQKDFDKLAEQLPGLNTGQARRLHSTYVNNEGMPSRKVLTDYYAQEERENPSDTKYFRSRLAVQDWAALLAMNNKKADIGTGEKTLKIGTLRP